MTGSVVGKGWLLALGIALALHAAALVYFAAPRIALQGMGPTADAHGLTLYLLERALDARALGLPRFYDASVMAGMVVDSSPISPAGLIGDVALVLAERGVPLGRAYGGLWVALHASVPAFAVLFAWAAELKKGALSWVVLLWSTLWWFDSLFHWSWYSGRLGLATAVLIAPVAIAGVVRDGNSAKRVFAIGIFTLFAYVSPVFALLAGVSLALGLVARAPRGRAPGAWVMTLAPLLVALGASGLKGLSMGEPAGTVFSSKANMLVTDLFDVLSDDYRIEGNVRTVFRTVVFVAAGFGFWRWGRVDERTRALVPAVVLSLALAYLGGYVPLGWPVDPHVFLLVAALLSTWPAASTLSALRDGSRAGWGFILIAALIAIPRVVRTVMNFVPELVPHRVIRSAGDFRVSPLAGLNERFPLYLGTASVPPWYAVARQRVRTLDGRVLVLDRGFSTYLARNGDVPVIGPLALRHSRPAFSDPRLGTSVLDEQRLSELLAHHAVHWAITFGPLGDVDRQSALLEAVEVHEGARLYRVRSPTRRVATGTGRVVRSDRTGIEVEGAMGHLTLRYWHDALLKCHPGCRVARSERTAQQPLLVVPAAPERFRLVPSRD